MPAQEVQASRALDVTLEKFLPGIISRLPKDVINMVKAYVYDSIPNSGARIPIELILRMKYDFLVLNNHIKPFTPEQIASAVTAHKNKASSESENRTVLTDWVR